MTNKYPGNFIVFEGPDGGGTTTYSRLLKEDLAKLGISVTSSFEPTDGTIGKVIRQILQGKFDAGELELALLFAADRTQDVNHNIIPSIKNGNTHINDRYYFSSKVYQGYLSGIDPELVTRINQEACKPIGFQPDLLFYLDTIPEIAIGKKAEQDETEKYDLLDFQHKIRDSYIKVLEEECDSERVHKTSYIYDYNGPDDYKTKSIDEMRQEILEVVLDRLDYDV